MPVKDKAKQKKISNAWYQKNRDAHIANIAKNKRRYRAEWVEFKSSLQCAHCGFTHPAVIDFHHVIRDKGKQSVNVLISHGRFAAAREEIKKCIPLCANCHRILHWDESKAKQASLSIQSPKKETCQTETSRTDDSHPSHPQPDSPSSQFESPAYPLLPKAPRTQGNP